MTDVLPANTAFEVRFDALVTRMRSLAKVAGGGTIGNELQDVAAEMVRVRRDMAYVIEQAMTTVRQAARTALDADIAVADANDAVAHATRQVEEPERRPYATRGTSLHARRSAEPGGRNGKARQGTQKIRGSFVKLPAGKRWCAGHNDGDGAMLNVADFKVKNPRTGALTSWCTDCTRRYQQERYVRVGYRRVTIEIAEGDACLGHNCPLCDLPFEIGQRIQGSDVAHETCLNRADLETDVA